MPPPWAAFSLIEGSPEPVQGRTAGRCAAVRRARRMPGIPAAMGPVRLSGPTPPPACVREGSDLHSGQAMARLPGETAPIVLTLFAWSRRVIAAFIPLSLIALIWGLAGPDVSGRRLSLDLNPVWQVGLIIACTLSVVVSLVLRRLARKIDSEVRYLGSIDALTGLLNRRGLSARLERPNIAVLYLDLDRFKAVNDGMGHDTGDDVLRAVADRIKAVLRPADAAARLGGDEFVVVVEDK